MENILEALNVRVVGNGDRYVVMAHGFGTDQSVWRRVLPYLTPEYRLVLFDLACSGCVNPDLFDFRRYTSLDAYVDDLLLIIDSLAIPTCQYVGHSISALIGILAAIRRPSAFSKLVLMGVSPRYLNDEGYDGGFEREEIEVLFAAMQSNYEAWAQGFAPLAVGADVPEAVMDFSRTLFNMRPDISLHVCRTVFECDFRGVLGLVRTRCVILHTLHDRAVPASAAQYMSDHLGGHTTFILLETEGHLPHISAPAITGMAIRRALRAAR